MNPKELSPEACYGFIEKMSKLIEPRRHSVIHTYTHPVVNSFSAIGLMCYINFRFSLLEGIFSVRDCVGSRGEGTRFACMFAPFSQSHRMIYVESALAK